MPFTTKIARDQVSSAPTKIDDDSIFSRSYIVSRNRHVSDISARRCCLRRAFTPGISLRSTRYHTRADDNTSGVGRRSLRRAPIVKQSYFRDICSCGGAKERKNSFTIIYYRKKKISVIYAYMFSRLLQLFLIILTRVISV